MKLKSLIVLSSVFSAGLATAGTTFTFQFLPNGAAYTDFDGVSTFTNATAAGNPSSPEIVTVYLTTTGPLASTKIVNKPTSTSM